MYNNKECWKIAKGTKKKNLNKNIMVAQKKT